MEPFSEYGKGDKRLWDGIKKQSTFSDEIEALIQNNTTYKLKDVKLDQNNKLRFYFEVIEQKGGEIK